MEIIKARSFARAGLLGNPSDGYFGKTLSFAFANFGVDLTLMESSRMRFVPGEVDDAVFDSPEHLVHDIRIFGYYGGIRMLKAVAKLFFEYCMQHGIEIPSKNFTAEYKINVPRLVGLSGSSAICSAMLKALMKFYGVKIPEKYAPTLCLEAERDELGINCGYQDRVIQMYNGLVFMDFNKAYLEEHSYGMYERLSPQLLPNLYVAYDPNRAEESGKAHKKVKKLFEQKSPDVISAMSEFADIAQKGRDALLAGRSGELSALIDANFDLRDSIFNVSDENRHMINVARAAGASAKFAGSGGAIVGTYEDEEHFKRISAALSNIGCRTIKPIIVETDEVNLAGDGVWRNS
ncbi:MAG: GHMP kinase [Kiritimatiellae bacterium]|nr:GHMP kinase [Kiritimatiellia bacterium]